MSSIAVQTHGTTAALSGADVRKSFWSKIYDRVMHSQQARAEKAVAAYLSSHGGLLTDDMEREIMAKFSANNLMSRAR